MLGLTVLPNAMWLVAGGAGLAALLVWAWIGSLRRQVRTQMEKVQREKKLLATLVDQLPDNVFAKDTSGRYFLSNRAHAEFHGAPSRDHFLGKTGADLLPPEVARRYAKSDQNIFDGKIDSFQDDELSTNKDGDRRWIATTKVPLKDEAGKIIGLVGLSRDMTERRQVELRLAAFSSLGHRMSSARTIREAALTMVDVADILMPWDACSCDLYLRTEDLLSNVLSMDVIEGQRVDCSSPGERQVPPPLTRRAIEQGGFLLSADPAEGTRPRGVPFGDTRRRSASLLFVPISCGDEVIGVLTVQSYTPKAYKKHHLETLQALADLCGGALNRILTEEVLGQAQSQLRHVLSQSPAVIYTLKLDEEGFVPSWISENVTRLLGFDSREACQVNWWSAHIHPEDREAAMGGWAEIATKDFISVEYRFQHKNGHDMWLRDEQRLVRDANGEPVEIVGAWSDITDYKRAEAELAYERDLLRTLLDNVPDSIYFKDQESRFVRVSKSKVESAHNLALTRHKLLAREGTAGELPAELKSAEAFAEALNGKTDFDIYDVERARPAYEDEQQIIQTGKPVIDKMERTVCPDGSVIWSLTTKMPWRDKTGRIIGTFGLSRDITPIKQAEAELERMHKRLVETSREAGMAEVATSVLHNVGNVLNSVNVSATLMSEQVKRSKLGNLGRAAQLMRDHAADLGEFLMHDARGRQLSPYLEQLAGHLTEEQAALLEELESLRKNIEHIKNIVAMQQSYAKVAGVAETVLVTDLVEDALRMNEGALVRHNVQLCRDYEPALPPITVEKHKVLQILVNLIRNAKYACDESERPDKLLTLRVRRIEEGVRVLVIDNGVGIPRENLERIFNLGFTTRKDGHGFGLHSGALAAREIGGSLMAHSDGPGQGATFTLELPLKPNNR
jgi:PAS domain S-box-containing protein